MNEVLNQYSLNRNIYIQNVNNILLMLLYVRRKKQKGTARKFWIRDIFKNRKLQGVFYNLLPELRFADEEKHFNYLRMSKEAFDELLGIVGPEMQKIYCIREPISPGERLALTLRYLASGDSMSSISYAFRIGNSTVSQIIFETCNILWNCLNADVLLTPTEANWLKIAEGFERHWQLPHCVGAMDGKHVVIQAPPNSGSTFYNYKGSHSLILLALCDADYKFTMVDIGAQGRHSDGGVLRNSNFGKELLNNRLDFPPPSPIEYGGECMNYYVAADEAFPLTSNMMRPYPGRLLPQDKRIFNYRLCRGRRVIENTFGIFSARWRIFRKPIIASIETTENIIKAAVCLHNWLMIRESNVNKEQRRYFSAVIVDHEDNNGVVVDGEWRKAESVNNLSEVRRISSNMYTRNAALMREQLTSYFQCEGAVLFQWNK